MILSDKAVLILEKLNQFKYLSTQQLIALGVATHQPNIALAVSKLEDKFKPLINKIAFGAHPKHGRLENIYYLTKHGAEFLIENLNYSPESIYYPKNITSLYQADYFHRKNTVYFNIHFQNWLECNNYDLEFANYYFDRTGSNKDPQNPLKSKNKIMLDNENFIIPDFIAKFKNPERSFLFLAEVHHGKTTKRAIEQIVTHAKALNSGKPQHLFDYQKAIRIYYVLELPEYKKFLLDRLQNINGLEKFNNHFLFKTIKEMQADFWGGWEKMNGEKCNFI